MADKANLRGVESSWSYPDQPRITGILSEVGSDWMSSRKSKTELIPRSVDRVQSVFSIQMRLLLLRQRDGSVMVPETSLPTCSRCPVHIC